MRSLILSTAVRFLLPLLMLFSFFILIRGHNAPGGGFIGGLIASAALALYTIAHDVQRAKAALRLPTIVLIGAGLLTALLSGVLPLLSGRPFLTVLWLPDPLPVLGKVGTAFSFDVGVYLVVVGVTLRIIFAMAEEEVN